MEYSMSDAALTEISKRRFAVFPVPHDQPIRVFCETNHIEFRPGAGFYELIKRVLVQGTKEIVLMNRHDRTKLYTGKRARQMLGLPLEDEDVTITPVHLRDWIPFIQSTSYNRKLLGGTRFLFEWPNWDKEPPSAWDRLLEEDLF